MNKRKIKTVLVRDYEKKTILGVVEWNDEVNDYIFIPDTGVVIDMKQSKKVLELIKGLKK